MTYGQRDDLADKIVQPAHFQLFMKRLRRRGHFVRYLVAGEYGKLKDRAHFHALLFFQNIEPLRPMDVVPFYNPDHISNPEASGPFSVEMPNNSMCHIREWPHGHVKVDWSVTEKSAKYVCKYLLDDDKNNAWFSLSKKPPIGAAWFAQKAALLRELETIPSSFEYHPPGGTKGRPYLMTGATRRDFLAALGDLDHKRPQMSEWVQRTYDQEQRILRRSELEVLEAETIRANGFPEPPGPDPDETYKPEPPRRDVASQIDFDLADALARVDPDKPWPYQFSEWFPPERSADGTKKGGFFSQARIFNPKQKPAPRSHSGKL